MRQRGVALIIVLLLLSMTVIIASQIMESLEHERTRTENTLLQEQGYAYLLSAESLAMLALQADLDEDRKSNQQVDACGEEEWAVGQEPITWDNATFTVAIQDLQGRFNLNNLAPTQGEERLLDRQQVERLKRILRQVLPTPDGADPLAEEAADWTDSNALVDGLGGAEDTEYQEWRTSNVPFAHVSELRALLSADPAWWQGTEEYPSFARFLSVLPEGTRINVNTAPAEVLQALATGMDRARADAIVAARQGTPFDSVDTFLAVPEVASLPEGERKELKDAVTVGSEYFQVVSQVAIAGRAATLVSIVYRPRQGGTMQVVMRDLGATFMAPEGACNPGWEPPEEPVQE